MVKILHQIPKLRIMKPTDKKAENLTEHPIKAEAKTNKMDSPIGYDLPHEIKRKDWEVKFKEMADNGDDDLVIPDLFQDEDVDGWEWQSAGSV